LSEFPFDTMSTNLWSTPLNPVMEVNNKVSSSTLGGDEGRTASKNTNK